ncbi:hypothetical protein BCR34DRAFT_613829 [Clohesyomyces aquaticus]|uniref:Uncharacterized protein n=1 Tax=Clohesyomyces aquaticus TaxID=1231657 RepID=A0A1Y1ZRA8_9PLEO|nr:hypothetical protein BCR34DRAFT_613829 [Clohesyomyces aquaticus]
MPIQFKPGSGRISTVESRKLRDLVAGKVRPQGSNFPVYAKSLCMSWKSFQSTIWVRRGTSLMIDLVDEDPDTFETYLHWLYFRNIPTAGSTLGIDMVQEQKTFAN